jgi:DNA polymerase IV
LPCGLSAKQLLQEVDYEHHPIRLIGLSVSNPREEEEKGVWEQLSFEFSDWETDHSNK